jgi:hypothetical protein
MFILEKRYKGPYTLRLTSAKDLWRRSVILGGLRTLWVVCMSSMLLITTPADLLLKLLPICGAVCIGVFAVTTLHARWDFGQTQRRYQRESEMFEKGAFLKMSEMFEKSAFLKTLTFPFMSMLQIFMSSEEKLFYQQGYAGETESTPDEQDEVSSGKS